MIVLGIETSTPVCSIGVADGLGGTWETSVVDRHVHSDLIVTLIRQTVEAAGIGVERLESVAVSSGPGSFTGLRIGMSTAKGLCKALNVPIVAVPTFEAVACAVFDADGRVDRVMVAVDAKRDDFYIALLERAGGTCRPMAQTAVVPLAELRSVLGNVRVLCTDRPAQLLEHFGDQVTVLEMQQFLSGARIAQLGRERAVKGQVNDVVSVEPLYLKDFVVRQPSDR